MNIETTLYEECNGKVLVPFNPESIGLKGVWALYGKESVKSDYICLNVGKSINIGKEIIYDLGCLKYVDFRQDGNKKYINQFKEDCDFYYKPKQTREYLYPFIQEHYCAFKFVFKSKKNEASLEKAIAEENNAKFWRNGGSYSKV